MASAILACGFTVHLDLADLPVLRLHNWRSYAPGPRNKTRYVSASVAGRKVYLHRYLIGAPKGIPVDHENRDGLDNRRANLRLANYSLNNVNKPTRNSTGFRGVWRGRSGAFYANISDRSDGGTCVHIGTFATAEDAARAYDAHALRRFGEFAQLNFPPQRSAA